MTLEQLREKLKASNISDVAKATGVSRPSLTAIRDGKENLAILKLYKVFDYFDSEEATESND